MPVVGTPPDGSAHLALSGIRALTDRRSQSLPTPLGDLRRAEGRLGDAEQAFGRALAVAERHPEARQIDHAAILDNLGALSETLESNASLHSAIFARMRVTGALETKTCGC